MNATELTKKLQTLNEVFVIFSVCTKMPYTTCDEETFDDQIYMYFEERKALDKANKLITIGEPVQNVRIEKNSTLRFLTNLWTMGVNCILVNEGMADESRIQLSELTAQPGSNLPDGQKWYDNPALHLTCCQIVQILRKKPLDQQTDEEKKEVQALSEEAMAHFSRGCFFIPKNDEKGVPLIKLQNGEVFQPIFTDIIEFTKFNSKNEFKPYLVEAKNLGKVLAKEAGGFTVNPTGVSFQVKANKPKNA